jgi:cardiolipin synthase A/B
MAIIFTFFGILALVLLILALFTPFGQASVRTSAFSTTRFGEPEFYRALESITRSPTIPLRSDEDVQVLSDGAEFLPDLLKEISDAKFSINIANYIWDRGRVVNPLLDSLTNKAREGVEVRLLMDGLGARRIPKDKIKILREAGGRVAIFRPLTLGSITRLNRRHHARAIIIDGRVGYTGGAPFKDGWEGEARGEDKWRDLMFKFYGQPARSLQNMFSTLWRHTHGEILVGAAFYPDLREYPQSENGSYYATLLHSPTADLDKDLSQLIWLSLNSAQKSILIETPYFMPDDDIYEVLINKLRQGLRVEIILPYLIDTRFLRDVNRTYYADLLKAGAKIYEYKISKLHSKVIVVDGRWSVIGSANLDRRSLFLDLQSVIAIDDSQLAMQIIREFEADKENSDIIPPHFKAPPLERLTGRLGRIFIKQL